MLGTGEPSEALQYLLWTYARKEEEPGISVTSWRNMYPKREVARDFGNKWEEHVPEKRRSQRFL
jgi:hypothetical protein